MTARSKLALVMSLVLLTIPIGAFARGRGGGYGGGGRGGSGGGASRGGGGGYRSGAASRPATSRPSGGGANRPGAGGANRPNYGGGASRPGGGGDGNRPGVGSGNRPGAGSGDRPGSGGGNRPGIGDGNRPGIGTGNRPGIGDGNRPGIGSGNRPGLGDSNRPGIGSGNRPGLGGGDRPGSGGGYRPGLGGGDRPGTGGGYRPGLGGGNRPGPGRGSNIGNNVTINNNRRHGAWGRGLGWGLGFRAGFAFGRWGGFWNRPWFAPVALWGVGAWGLGPVVYDSGYSVYGNPYAVGDVGYHDYSQPIRVAAQPAEEAAGQDAPEPSPEVVASRAHLDAATDAFSASDYAKAGAELELAIKATPTDAALHEFRALVYFATGDYSKAAGTLYAVLSAGPGWDWTTMSSLYPQVETYTAQYRALEEYAKAHLDEADAHFVLAYHYMTGSHKEAAVRQLKQAARVHPDDQLIAQLIQSLGEAESATAVGTAAPVAQDSEADTEQLPLPDLDPGKIVGRRTAKRADGTIFTLNLTADNKFTWGYVRGGKSNEFGGTYSVDGAVLLLERSDKSVMPGLVTMQGPNFNFKLFGASPDDPGLDFKK